MLASCVAYCRPVSLRCATLRWRCWLSTRPGIYFPQLSQYNQGWAMQSPNLEVRQPTPLSLLLYSMSFSLVHTTICQSALTCNGEARDYSEHVVPGRLSMPAALHKVQVPPWLRRCFRRLCGSTALQHPSHYLLMILDAMSLCMCSVPTSSMSWRIDPCTL